MTKHNIKIIVLDINKKSADYKNYFSLVPGIIKTPALNSNLTAIEEQSKLDHIIKRIHAICKKMQITHPESMWIVVWREYGIFSCHRGTTEGKHFPVSSSFKKQMKRKLLELTSQYPNLIIIAGTIAIAKKYLLVENLDALQEKLKRIEKYYEELTWLANEEFVKEKTKEIMPNKEHVQQVANAVNKYNIPSVISIRNSCYVLQGKEFTRHDKVSPYREFNLEACPRTVFQPGTNKTNKGRNTASPFIILTHPVTKEKITIVVEICREHRLNWANFALSQKFLSRSYPAPYLHFVLADSIDLTLKNSCAPFTVLVDSCFKPNLITFKKLGSAENIELYFNNLLKDDKKLTLLQPIYPFEWKINDLLLEIKELCVVDSNLLNEFELHYKNFETLDNTSDGDNYSLYDFISNISKWLIDKQWEYLNATKSVCSLNNPFSLFSHAIRDKKAEEMKKYGEGLNDVHSRSNFALNEVNGKLEFFSPIKLN